jgi:uncharacterized Ntn-hydrolase superfamily protein
MIRRFREVAAISLIAFLTLHGGCAVHPPQAGGTTAGADSAPAAPEPPSTFSIAAFDPQNGDLGVAVASRFLAVGAVVPWVRAGAGAIATQAYANTSYGPRGLALLAERKEPRHVVEILTGGDPEAARRQLGVVDAAGRTASFTGERCHPWAGDQSGKHYTVQGNLLVGAAVLEAMAAAFEKAEGELADRLLAALEAGDRAGGDARGRQSAALHVARQGGGYGGFDDRYVLLHVDDHPRPVRELRRLLDLRLRRDAVSQARHLASGGRAAEALEMLAEAEHAYPEWVEPAFEKAAILLGSGRREEGRSVLREAIARDPESDHHRWRAALLLARAGLDDEALAALHEALRLNPGYREVLRRELEAPASPLRRLLPAGLDSLPAPSRESPAKEPTTQKERERR